MPPVEIVPGVDWVGTLDPDLRVFDVIMKAEHGTTYNSYLVRGETHTALVETSKGGFTRQYLESLATAIDPAKIDYIVLNHMEPDHSGALGAVLDACPNALVLLTRPGLTFAKNVANRDFPNRVVADGEVLDLGGRSLTFLITPYLHWPDTMMTYLAPDGILFPCDFLGAHYCDGRLFNDLVPGYDHLLRYYFQAIMRPFKEYVRAGLAKIEPLDLKVVAPSHGPIIRTEVQRFVELYRAWAAPSEPRSRKRLLVFYASAYGNTRLMAEEIVRGAEEAGAEARSIDLTGVDFCEAADEIEEAEGIAVGSCTINADALEHAWTLLSSLATINIKKKLGASFGSYGWSGEGPKMLAERLKGLKFRVPEEPLRVQLVPTDDDLKACRAYGATLAAAL